MLIELNQVGNLITCLLFVKFWWNSLNMWTLPDWKIFRCEWCFSFWTSLLYSLVFFFLIEKDYFLLMYCFVIPPLNSYVNGIIQRY